MDQQILSKLQLHFVQQTFVQLNLDVILVTVISTFLNMRACITALK